MASLSDASTSCLVCLYRFQRRITWKFHLRFSFGSALLIPCSSMNIIAFAICFRLRLCPARISRAFAHPAFGTDINKERQLLLLMHLCRPCLCGFSLQICFYEPHSCQSPREFFNRISFAEERKRANQLSLFPVRTGCSILCSYPASCKFQSVPESRFSCQCCIVGYEISSRCDFSRRVFPFSSAVLHRASG